MATASVGGSGVMQAEESNPEANTERFVTLGKVSGIFGVQGWVKVFSYTRPTENILSYSPWYLRRAGQWQAQQVVEGREHGKALVAHLEGVDDRDVARGLIGTEIAVKRSQLPPPAEGQHYHFDLIGLKVTNRDCVELGTVQDIIETGAHDVLVVRGEKEHLIPLVMGVHVRRIDEWRGTMEVDWGADY